MIKVGLTGGIGSGKSTVAKIFETLGVPVFYADDAAKEMMNNNEEIRKKLIQHFGNETYNEFGLNRKHLSSLVFDHPEKLKLLNSIVHPITIKAADDWMLAQKTPYVLKEAALIFETDAWKHLDFVIGVFAPENLRIQRVMNRDGISEQEIRSRINRQMNEDEKMSKCKYVITNDEQELLIPQVIKIHQEILKEI